jgi:hypothetical protein
LLKRGITTIWGLAPSRSALRRLSLVGLAALAIGVLMGPVPAMAVHDTGVFELDGNIKWDGNATYDWGKLFDASGASIVAPNAVLLNSTFLTDSALPDPTYFKSNGGGVKDTNPISNWGCTTISNPTPKDNLQNAYAAIVQVPVGAPDNGGDLVLYLGSERASNNGDSFAGFWLFKGSVACDSTTGTFTGSHTDGDILVVSNFTNGGGTQDVNVYEWQAGTLVSIGNGGICGASTPDAACAIANNAALPAASIPWLPGSSSGILTNTFVEAGVDLTRTFGASGQSVPCFSFFQAETRSSQSLTATLKDFAGGNFNTCNPPLVTTSQNNSGPALNVAVGTPVTDVANLSGIVGTPGVGTLTYSLYTGTGCLNGSPTGDLVNSSTVNVTAAGPQLPSFTFTPASAGTWQWIARYTGDGGRNQPSTSNCGGEPLRVVDANISIVPNGVNEVGHQHTFTITVNALDGGSGLAPSYSISTSVSPSPTSQSNTCASPVLSNNNDTATCTLTINSSSAGVFTATATAMVTMGGVTVTRSTDSTHGSSGPATKTFVDGSISLTPLTATNFVGQVHTITAIVTQDSGTGPGLAPGVTVNFTIVSGDATFVGAESCVTGGLGTCTIDITSPNAGTNVIHATATWTVNGVSITRSTGDTFHGDGPNVQKIFIPRTPSLLTTVLLGDTVNITGFNLAGTADFTLYGPSLSGPVCSGTPLAQFLTQPLTVSADKTSATASTPSTTAVTQSGVYSWQVTFNTGNSSNTSATTTCTSEVVTISYSPGQNPPVTP